MRPFYRFFLTLYTLLFALTSLAIALLVMGLVGSAQQILAYPSGVSLKLLGWEIPYSLLENFFWSNPFYYWSVIVLGFFLFLFGIYVMIGSFKSGIEDSFLVNRGEMGEVTVTRTTLENIILNFARKNENIEEAKTKLKNTAEGVIVFLTVAPKVEVSFPEIAVSLQEALKKEIESKTGVKVKEIRIKADNSLIKGQRPK